MSRSVSLKAQFYDIWSTSVTAVGKNKKTGTANIIFGILSN
jgi:hypothetical protein